MQAVSVLAEIIRTWVAIVTINLGVEANSANTEIIGAGVAIRAR